MVPHPMKLDAFFKPENLEDYRSAMAEVRGVMSRLTNVDVAARMMTRAGFIASNAPRTIAVLADGLSEGVRTRFAAQSYTAKILLDSSTLGGLGDWNEAKRQHNIDYFCFFSAEDDYEPGYLDDLVNGFKYTASRYVAKASWFNGSRHEEGPQHEYIASMPGRARTMFAATEFQPAQFLHLAPHEATPLAGGYAIDPFELNYRRFLRTWRQETTDPVLTVVKFRSLTTASFLPPSACQAL